MDLVNSFHKTIRFTKPHTGISMCILSIPDGRLQSMLIPQARDMSDKWLVKKSSGYGATCSLLAFELYYFCQLLLLKNRIYYHRGFIVSQTNKQT